MASTPKDFDKVRGKRKKQDSQTVPAEKDWERAPNPAEQAGASV